MGISSKSFDAEIASIDEAGRRQMEESSWRPGCPVQIEDLRTIGLTHWDFSGQVREGTIVVHESVADDVVSVFRALFDAAFPLERLGPIDAFDGDDDRSMAANNSCGFNGREIALTPGVWSQHASGLAIDLNPVQNPYVRRDGSVLPETGHRYLDRTQQEPGMIQPNDAVVRAFSAIGWGWGGDWEPNKDYQHFSANGA
ncbi:MAG: M15 family metallopeptidase [Actinomycetota bacterium]